MRERASHWRVTISSAEKDQIQYLQQSMMTSQRERRIARMSLIEKRDEDSKIYNHIMTVLKESNIIKKLESYRFKKTIDFSTKRRSQKKLLSNENTSIIHEWFNVSSIIIEKTIKTSKQRTKAKRLLYIWKNCFVMKMSNIKIIDLMKHSIKLKSKSRLVKSKIFRYILKKREFANEIFSQMKKTKIIIRIFNDWRTRTKFSFKKKNSDQLRIVHNYIFLNDCTVKMQYSVHRIEKNDWYFDEIEIQNLFFHERKLRLLNDDH
jgi:hypothetical protein